MNSFDWSELAFSNKGAIKKLKPIFIAAPRDITSKRLAEIVKMYLPLGNVLLGISKEDYVLGLEGQPQFKMLNKKIAEPIVKKVQASKSPNKLYLLDYSQADLKFILEKIKPKQVVLVNGSWYQAYHHKPEYYLLKEAKIDIDFVSPFSDEAEAKKYAAKTKIITPKPKARLSDREVMEYSNLVAKKSYDFGGYQTSVVIAKKLGSSYKILLSVHNKVVPYETYSMHYGASRELNHSPLQDLNHYDTVHAEILSLIKAQKDRVNLEGASLFISLMPCPTCARALAETDISEFVYSIDHSNGYAVKMLEAAGKKVRRLVL